MTIRLVLNLLILVILNSSFSIASAEEPANLPIENSEQRIATVIDVSKPVVQEGLGYSEQIVKIRIKGETEDLFITHPIPDNKAYAILAKKGKQYIVSSDPETNQVYITDYFREPTMIMMLVGFFILVIVLGGFKGFTAIVSLALTGLAVFYFLIPGIKQGGDPVTLAVLVAAFSTAVTALLIAGWTKKSLAATIGTTGGVTVAGLISMYIIQTAPLSGLASTEAQMLVANPENSVLNFQGMLAAGIIISSLGAALDVAVSIASAAQELYETNPNQSKRELLRHCMNIGRDIMGTMVDTLILAYTGSSMSLLLLLYNEAGLRFLNMEIIAAELTLAVVGSVGLLLSVPITALVAVFLLKGFKKKAIIE